MHKFFCIISLLYFSTCFEHFCAHHHEFKIVLLQHLISSQYVGGRPVHTCAPDDQLQSVTKPDAV